MKVLHMVAFTLLAIGGLNWGIVGVTFSSATPTNLVHSLLGGMPSLEMLVYILVGLSAVVELATHKKNCKCCDKSNSMGTPAM